MMVCVVLMCEPFLPMERVWDGGGHAVASYQTIW